MGLFPPTATGMKAEAPTPAATGVNAAALPAIVVVLVRPVGELVLLGETLF